MSKNIHENDKDKKGNHQQKALQELIARTIRAFRKDSGFSQTQVAKMLNIGRSTYSNYENAHRLPDIFVLSNLAILYNVPIERFCIGQEPYNDHLKESASYGTLLNQSNIMILAPEEMELLKRYRELNKNSRQQILKMIDTLL